MKDLYVPAAWGVILSAVRSIAPSAVIAGGCLRDIAWGGQVKDIDIFYDARKDNVQGMARTLGWKSTLALSSDYGRSFGMRSEVVAVHEFRPSDVDVPVQVIGIKLPEHATQFAWGVINRMDFDCCRAAYDGHEIIYGDDFFLARYRRLKVFKLVRCEDATQAVRSLKRAERFAARYPDAYFDLTLAEPYGFALPDVRRIA